MKRTPLLDRLVDAVPGSRTIVRHPPDRPIPTHPLPTVTVVVPCYNYGHFLDTCVTSLLEQRDVEVDVLIIDDASPDGSGDIAQQIADTDKRVRVERHVTNKGHLATYNDGLDLATGEFVVVLDADDVLVPGALARATALMRSHPSVGLVYGHPRSFTGEPPDIADTRTRSWSIWRGADWIEAQCRRGLSIIYSPEVVMRTSVQRPVGGFRSELPHAGDLDLWLRIAAVADIGRVNGPDQAFRRVHPHSMMQTGYGTVLLDLKGRLDALESFFTRDADGLPKRAALHQLARRKTAEEALAWVNGQLARPPADRASSEEIDAYVDFTVSLYPQRKQLRGWREYDARTCRADAPMTPAIGRLGVTTRGLLGRYAFQRWYWNGY